MNNFLSIDGQYTGTWIVRKYIIYWYQVSETGRKVSNTLAFHPYFAASENYFDIF
jgi:hypothetical protein